MNATAGLSPPLRGYVAARMIEYDQIREQRRSELRQFAQIIAGTLDDQRRSSLIFICTHNSRRSHLAQLWAQTASYVYGVAGVETYSGGTEATAFNPRAVAAVERAGFRTMKTDDGDNPVYEVRFGETGPVMECFSKVYDQPPNPTEGFIAVMTCSAADEACPIVFGADERVAIPFEDPKAFDGTDRESEMYDERCRQIAREMLYLFSEIAS